jgi:hypothetical protein
MRLYLLKDAIDRGFEGKNKLFLDVDIKQE